jgi:SAM-dependent methyltransferase
MSTDRSTAHAAPASGLDGVGMAALSRPARIGRRELRPGGLGLTQELVGSLAIRNDDAVVEFAPGLGVATRLILAHKPGHYIGIERDAEAAAAARQGLPQREGVSFIAGRADATGLADESATVVLGEALLSMNSEERRQRIVAEARRLLRPGGHYGVHELCLEPDDLAADRRRAIDRELSEAGHVGAHPLPARDWIALLENAGLRVVQIGYAPMHLLCLRRLVVDEGLGGALRVARSILADQTARNRAWAMHRLFRRHRDHLRGIYLVAEKPA